MITLSTITNIITILIPFLIVYLNEKSKNLATKQDIEEITRKTESIQKEFKESFEIFSSDVEFKYDFYFKQYSILYSHLYSIVTQSEYLRYFSKISEKKDYPFEDFPFLELTNKKTITKFSFKSDAKIESSSKTEIINTPLTEFNKKNLCNYILENAAYADQSLLKLAVEYRFAYEHYGNDKESSNVNDTANDEELRLIREIVCHIVKEYNFLRKELNMSYDENELNTGIMIL